ncbi:hypothetical protein F5141DRAFT_1249938 [Pisolithus sp. B1]|nr:hypothetical protein F5141DRAFT_1249938 [Pisolithus sp. B1]
MSKRGFAHVRVGHAGAPHTLSKRESCTTGGFYTNPTTGMTVSSSDNFNISWDTSCLSGTSAVDIYLHRTPTKPRWNPKWWNDSSSIQLQLSIVTSGTQPFLSPFPAGPVFTATYTAPTSGSTPADANLSTPDTVTYVNNFPTPSSLTSGKIAAGVLVPLFFIGLGVAYYIKMSRAKAKEKTQRFSQAIDRRMSTISSDWKSISVAGASAAIRNSIAVPGGARASSAFSFGSIRPIRVSFAADVRPSMESRRTVASRAFHVGHLPPLPMRQDSNDLSPIQTEGAFSLTPEDITARISGETTGQARPSMDEVWPSLTMMRTGTDDTGLGDDYLFPSQAPVEMPLPPTPAHAAPTSPIGMIPMSASVMSPDAMLRAYAGRKMTSPPGSPVAFPVPVASYDSRGRRTLYSPNAAEPSFPSPIHVKQRLLVGVAFLPFPF